jgi:general secretion pathway protein G
MTGDRVTGQAVIRNVLAGPRGSRRRAFTLIELMLVMVILAILAAVVIPKLSGRTEQARLAAAKTDISSIESALDTFEIDNGRYPTTDEGLAALTVAPNGLANWHGPYVKKMVTNDPWGNPYQYRCPETQSTAGYDLYSFGPDGREGGDDVTNWSTP